MTIREFPLPTQDGRYRFSRILIATLIGTTMLPILVIGPTLISALYNEVLLNTSAQLDAELVGIGERLRGQAHLLRSELEQLTKADDLQTALENQIFIEPAQRQLQRFLSNYPFAKSAALLASDGHIVAMAPPDSTIPALDLPSFAQNDAPRIIDTGSEFVIITPTHRKGVETHALSGYIVSMLDPTAFVIQRMNDLKRPESQLSFYMENRQIALMSSPQISGETQTLQREKQIMLDTQLPMTLVLSDPRDARILKARNVALSASLFAALSLLTSVVIGWWLSRRLIKPIKDLTRAADQYAQGHFEIHPETSRFIEFQKLSHTFLVMIGKIQENIRHLHIVIGNLELLFDEGRKLSAQLEIEALARQIQTSFTRIVGKTTTTHLLLDVAFFPNSEEPTGFLPVIRSLGNTMDSYDYLSKTCAHSIELKHHSENRLLGYIFLSEKMEADKVTEIITLLRALSLNISGALENILSTDREKEQIRMRLELETARIIQQHLLPRQQDCVIAPYEISGFFRAANEVAGDWWYYFPMRDGRILVLLGDVTGHGTPSALITAVIKGYCDSLYHRENISTSQVLEELHTEVKRSSDGSRYMTMFAGLVDPVEKELTFTSAGHPGPFIVRGNSEEKDPVRRLVFPGFRLGFAPDKQEGPLYKERTLSFQPGDFILVFSDGLIEGRNSKGIEFTEKRLRRLLSEMVGKRAAHIRDAVACETLAQLGNTPIDDDIAFFVLRYADDGNRFER